MHNNYVYVSLMVTAGIMQMDTHTRIYTYKDAYSTMPGNKHTKKASRHRTKRRRKPAI